MQIFFLHRVRLPPISVPFGMLLIPHVPAVQVRMWHAVSVPGHSLAAKHWTHAGAVPLPLHFVPLP